MAVLLLCRFSRFCAEIKRENYPSERSPQMAEATVFWAQPAHTITLLPTVLLVNLMPCDLNYSMLGGSGRLGAGAELGLTDVSFSSKSNHITLSCYFPIIRTYNVSIK